MDTLDTSALKFTTGDTSIALSHTDGQSIAEKHSKYMEIIIDTTCNKKDVL